MPELREYQRAGAKFLASNRNAILADEMGLGKTAQAIVAARTINAESILVVCPATLKENWRDEIVFWCPDWAGDIGLLKGRDNKALSRITIVNYDILKHNFELLASRRWDVCIADEVHYVKESKSQRTKALLGLRTEVRWALSGTPLLNRPIELYPILWWLRQPIASSKREYGMRYCAGFFDNWAREWNYRGASNEEELRRKVAPIFLRRLKADVLGELPPKTRSVVRMGIGGDGLAKINKASHEAEAEGGFQLAALTSGGFSWSSLGELAKLRALLGEQKAPAAAKYIREMAEDSGDKILVFAHHKAVMDHLEASLRDLGVVRIDGSTPVGQRQTLVKKFQSDPEVRIFLGNIKAAGVGITLTAAPLVVFAEYDWTPGVNEQAEDRAHRFGQERPVNIFYLVVDNSIDALIAEVLLRKASTLKTLLKASGDQSDENQKQETENNMSESINPKALGLAFAAIGSGFIKAAECLGATLDAPAPAQEGKPEKPAAAAKPAKPAKPAKSTVTKDQLVERIQAYVATNDRAAAKAVLTKLGFESVKDIPAESYDSAFAAFALESEGTSDGLDL